MRQLLASFAICLLAACPAKTKAPSNTAAVSGSTQTPEAKPAVATPPKTFLISPKTSSIGFVGAKTTGSHEGKFGAFSGSIEVPDLSALEKSSVSVEITMSEFETDQAKLTQHLKTPDFFDVERYPLATFRSTQVAVSPEAPSTYLITGDLSFHGVTKSITFPAEISVSEGAIVASSEFSLNRRDFGVLYTGKANDLIKDEVALKLSLRATQP